MPLLACRDYLQPILKILQQNTDGLLGSVLTENVADATSLSSMERDEAISDGTPKYVVRIKQARYRLKTSGLVTSLPGGMWAITSTGRECLEAGIVPSKRPRPRQKTDKNPTSQPKKVSIPLPLGQEDLVEAPLERIDRAVREIQDEVETELIQRLIQGSPTFFERAVLKLLNAMGYGDIEHTGGPGDGGIDGILYSDRLRLERVYVQAKRWDPNGKVGSPEITSFCGALSMNHAGKGVFITTAKFSVQAEDGAKKAPQVLRLIDGKRLAELMVEFGVGVSRGRTRTIPEIDRNFFDDA